ncbi:MAG TPA: AAA family ATPase [Acidimicrobiales bacterium]|nr:AAA family ATPase [Acidimicrobiales bacterium]
MVGAVDAGSSPHRAGRSVVVPCPVLVGRSHEVAVLAAAVDGACSGGGSVVFLFGEAGIGKSRLVQETISTAAERGARLLRGRAVPGSGAAAFRPLTEALAPVAAELGPISDLAAWLPALGAIVPTLAVADAVDVTPPVRGEAVLRLLSSVCSGRGGLLVLEDLHWADPETVAVVEHLSDNLDRAPVLCLVTVRSEEDSAARDLVRRVASRRTATVLELDRLNAAQVAAMVHSCADASDADVVERVVSMSEGVPFLVEEMLVSPRLPASFAEGVRARLAALPERDQRVLVAAAAFGRHFDWRLLAAASGVAEADVVDALDRGVATQLLAVEGDGFRFRHALTAEAVFESVTPPRREASASAALAALDEAYDEVPSDLRPVAARVAERAGQRERAGRLYLASGKDALARGALQTALVACKRATSLLPPGMEQDEALERLVDALVQIGRVDEAVATGRELVSRSPADRAARVHLRLAAAAVTAARWELAGEHLAAARPLVDSLRSAALRAELDLRDGEVALGVGEVECAALQLLGRCARRSSLETAEAWFRRAMDAADTHDLAVWRLRAQHELGTIALLDRSQVDDLLEAQRLAVSLGAMATAAVLDIEIAAGYAGLDDLDGQTSHGEQAVRRGTELGLDLIVAYGWQHVAFPAWLRGDGERAEAAAAAARAAAPGNRDIEGLLVGQPLLAALSEDNLERALDLAARMTDLLRGSETAPPAHHRAAWPVLLALTGGPDSRVEAAIGELEGAGVAVNRGGRAWLLLARAILAGRADPDRAAALAVEADGLLIHMPSWRSLARRLAAEAAAADSWQIPGGWLTEAEVSLRQLGYSGAADACRRLRAGAPDPVPPAWARLGITRREADVLALVVEGCSNREIADRLFLSVRTVEKHVESLLRKTATKSRTQLARTAAIT